MMQPSLVNVSLLLLLSVTLVSAQLYSDQHSDLSHSSSDNNNIAHDIFRRGAGLSASQHSVSPTCFGSGIVEVEYTFTTQVNTHSLPAGGLAAGMSMVWTGFISSKSQLHYGNVRSMQLALWTTKDSWFDTPLSLVFRWFLNGPSHMSMNTLSGGEWGVEQLVSPSPLRQDEQFTVTIKITPAHYEIVVGDRLVATYQHRIAFTRARYFYVSPDAHFSHIDFNL